MLEMSQPGWMGSLRVAGLYVAGIIVGGLGAGVSEQSSFLVGSSPGTYALIMAYIGMYLLIKYELHNLHLVSFFSYYYTELV